MLLHYVRFAAQPCQLILALSCTVALTHQSLAQGVISNNLTGSVSVSDIQQTANNNWRYVYLPSVDTTSPLTANTFRLNFSVPLTEIESAMAPSDAWSSDFRYRFALAERGTERLVVNRSRRSDLPGVTGIVVCHWPTEPDGAVESWIRTCGEIGNQRPPNVGLLPDTIPELEGTPTDEFILKDIDGVVIGREFHLTISGDLEDSIESYEQALLAEEWEVDYSNVASDLGWFWLGGPGIARGETETFSFVTDWGPSEQAVRPDLTGLHPGSIPSLGFLLCRGEECELRGPGIEPMPEPVAGDCNGDGEVDAGDLDCGCANDIDLVRMMANIPEGDINADGNVNVVDFLTLSRNFNEEGGYRDGDLTCDGQINVSDFLTLSRNFGNSSASTTSTVPEPSSSASTVVWMLLLVGSPRRWSGR